MIYQGKNIEVSYILLMKDRVLHHLSDESENLIGSPHEKIKLNTMLYKVEFPDGLRSPYATNNITE